MYILLITITYCYTNKKLMPIIKVVHWPLLMKITRISGVLVSANHVPLSIIHIKPAPSA